MEMAHLQYMPGDPRLVDQLVYELKSKGIFDQFRKECIADVDTRPAYQNLRQRVESSVSTFLGRQCWQPDLNKNQLREKLRKHILDGNYLEQGVERIVDQVVNPKVASVFIPQVEDLVYNYLGISRKKAAPATETANEKLSTEDLLPTDLEAVSPGSVKSTNDKNDDMDTDLQEEIKMDVEETKDIKEDSVTVDDKLNIDEVMALTEPILTPEPDMDIDKKDIPLPSEDIKLENIPAPENSPPKADNDKIELHKIELPKEPNVAKEIAAPEEIPLPMDRKDSFKPLNLQSDDESSSDSSLRRNMSPLTPIRNYNNENSCDAQQAFDNDSDTKSDEKKEPSTFRFTIDAKSAENSQDGKPEKKDEQVNLSYQFNNQVNITTFNTPMSDDSSNSNNLHIDYESDANSKMIEKVPEVDQNSEDSKKEKKPEDKKSSSKSSHRSRDSHRHSSSKDKRSDSKQSTSRDSSRQDRKSKDERSSSKSKSSHRDKSKDRSEKKDSRDSSRHRTSHKSSSQKDSKSHRSSSSSQKHITKHDDKKSSSSSHRDKNDKSSDKSSKDKEKDKDRRDSKSSSSRSEKDRKGSSSSSKSKTDDKDKKKEKKDNDDHYSLSGRGNPSRRSTDRDSNDGSSSSKGSHNPSNSKSSETKKETKNSNSKSDNTSPSGDSTSPSDKDLVIDNIQGTKSTLQPVRVENHLEVPIASPPRLPFVPDVTLKKPKFAANLKEAKQMMKMRKFLDEEQKRMNQEAALLLEFQANVRPSLSQVYSSIPGPELEFACGSSEVSTHVPIQVQITPEIVIGPVQNINVIQNIEPGNSVQDITIEDKKSIVSDVDTAHTSLEKETGGLENLNESITEDGGQGTYSENKPFSKLVEEITQYSKASERNKQTDAQTLPVEEVVNEDKTNRPDVTVVTVDDVTENEKVDDVTELRNESNEANIEIQEKGEIESKTEETVDAEMPTTESKNTEIENTVPTTETSKDTSSITQTTGNIDNPDELHYFAEHEKYDAEIKRHQYTTFLKAYIEKTPISSKIYLFNCDTYEENLIKEASESHGRYEIINYYRNGRLKLPKNVVKNVNLVTEITLPVDNFVKSPSRVDNYESRSPLFSPVKSECSFDLSSDYDAKLEEMVNKTSRQEVMEIILGSVINESDNPRIDYCTESSIDSDNSLKRKLDVETTVNNNRQVLVPKMRRLSESDQISSTTEEMERKNTKKTPLNTPTVTRSKYLGRAKRVGLSRPRRNLPNSPSSDQSVENYSQNPAPASAPASASTDKQRYHPSDLYKPKLHYLCRRNNIT